MIDAYFPDGALRPEAEAALLDRLTSMLMEWEGFDPTDAAMREVSCVGRLGGPVTAGTPRSSHMPSA